MKTKLLGILATCAIAATSFAPMTSEATPLTFEAILSGANEVPPNASTGTGLAIIVLDPTAQTIQLDVTFSGLLSNDTAAHIHCCAPLGTNAGVATMVPAFIGFPLGVTSGTYVSPVFDLTSASFYNSAFVTAQGSLANAESALISGIENGQTYFNIHTVNFGGGEIRGQLTAVPLPGALPLFATGLGALGLLGWRRKRKAAAAV